MKNIILLAFILTAPFLRAQHGSPSQITCDEYTAISYLDKFVGVWTGNLGNKNLKLILKKETINYGILIPTIGKNICRDAIIGFHIFSDNNIVLESSSQFSNTIAYDKKWTILGSTDGDDDPNPEINILRGTLEHISKRKSVRFIISYIDANHIKIENLKNLEGLKINVPGQPQYDPSISLPADIILTKQ